MPRTVLSLLRAPQLFQRPLLQSGDIGSADPALPGGLPLGHRFPAVQSVAQADDLRLALVEATADQRAQAAAELPAADALGHIVLLREHIHDEQAVALAVHIQRVRQAQLARALSLTAEIHEDLVLDAAAGIGRQPHVFVRPVGIDALDEPDRPDGDQIVRVVGGIVLLDDVRHQPQIVLHEQIARLQISLLPALEIFALLFPAQRSREGVARRNAEHQEQAVHQQKNRAFKHRSSPPFILFRRRLSPFAQKSGIGFSRYRPDCRQPLLTSQICKGVL